MYYLVEIDKQFYVLDTYFVYQYKLKYKKITKDVYINLFLKDINFNILWDKLD